MHQQNFATASEMTNRLIKLRISQGMSKVAGKAKDLINQLAKETKETRKTKKIENEFDYEQRLQD